MKRLKEQITVNGGWLWSCRERVYSGDRFGESLANWCVISSVGMRLTR